MLSKTQIQENKERFIKAVTNFVPNGDSLLERLGEEAFYAPYNRFNFMNNAFDGGLIDHILNLTATATKVNKTLSKPVDVASLYKVCLLAEIGKYNIFKKNQSDWHVKNQGKVYEWVDESDTTLRISERSLQLVGELGIPLTKEEFTAIVNMDKPQEDVNAKWDRNLLSVVLSTANKLTTADEQFVQVAK